MNETMSDAHDRVYRSFWQDGLLDLCAGLTLCCIGIAWISGHYVYGAIAPAIFVPMWSGLRKKLVEPRMGYVKFDETRQHRVDRSMINLLGVGCIVLIAGVVVYWISRTADGNESLLKAIVPALPAVLVGIGGWLCALMFGISRLAIYSAICVATGVALIFLDLNPGWSLLAGGAFTTLGGCILLVRFMNRFPKLQQEME